MSSSDDSSEDDDAENSIVDDDNDDDDEGSDSSSSGHIELQEDGNDESSSENNGSVVIINRTFTVTEHDTAYPPSDQERRQNKKESFLMHEVTTAEKLRDKINVSQSSYTYLSSVQIQENKCADSKNHVCDATYVIDSDEGYVSSRSLGLRNVVNKMVSPALPCLSMSSKQDTLQSREHCLAIKNISGDPDSGKDLVQADLCSRNKIVHAQSVITQKKLLRSCSKLCPQETKCSVNVLFSSNESGEENCGENDKIYNCKGNKEIDKASVMKGKSSTINEKENEARDFAKCRSLCSSLTNPRSFVWRQSMRLISDNSPTKNLPMFGKFHANSKKQLTRCSMRCSTPKRLTANGGIFESSKYDEARGRGSSGKGSKGHESNRSAVDGFQIDKILESKVGGERNLVPRASPLPFLSRSRGREEERPWERGCGERCGFQNEAPDLEKYQSVGTRSDKSHPFDRRKSMIISSDSCGENFTSSSSRKKSITLCQLSSSEASSHSWKNVEVPMRRSSPTHSGTDVGCVAVPQGISPNAQPQSHSSGDRLAFPEPSSQSFGIRRSRRSSRIHCEKSPEESLVTSQRSSRLAEAVATLPINRTMSSTHRSVSPSPVPQSPVIAERRKSSRPSSPSRKKSITLSQLTSSEASSHSWKNVEVPMRRSSPTHSRTDVGCVAVPQRICPNAQPQSHSSGDRLAFPEPSSQSFGIRRSRRSSRIHCEKSPEESLVTPSLVPQSPVIADLRKSSWIRGLSNGVFSPKLGSRRPGNVDHQNHRSRKCLVLRKPCEEWDEIFEDVTEKLGDSVQDVPYSTKGVMLTTSCGTRQQTSQSSGRESESIRSVKLFCSGRDEKARNRLGLRANPGNESCLSVDSQNGRMKRSRESDVDSSDLLRRKQPRRSSPNLKIKVKNVGTSIHGLETLSWQGKESTPVKWKNIKRLKDEEFSSRNMDLLSPIRSPTLEIHETSPRVFLSRCSEKQSCDKSFCFKCC